MPRNVSQAGVLAAKLSGIAAAVAHMKRLTLEQGQVEVQEILTSAGVKPDTDRGRAIVNAAADMYRGSNGSGTQWWFPAALEFLVRAGADP